MRQMKRGLAVFLALVMLLCGWTSGAVTVRAAGAALPESQAAETEGTKDAAKTGSLTEAEGETESGHTKEAERAEGSTEETESTEEITSTEEIESTEETTSTEEIESTEETTNAEETKNIEETKTTEETKKADSTEETESIGETESAGETESTEETEISEESVMLYGASPSVDYDVHMQSYGWLNGEKDGSASGKPGEGKRLEAVKIRISGVSGLGVAYQVYSVDGNWRFGSDGSVAGTTGEEKRVEAIKVSLTGTAANQYDIYYRAYIQGFGWLDWAKNGDTAGIGSSWGRNVEAIQVKVQAKGSAAPSPSATPYLEKDPDDGYANSHVNTGNRVNDLIAVAKTQVGYYKPEGTPTKFGTWYGANIANGSAYASAAWCAMFVSWCADQAGIPSKVFYRHSYTPTMAYWYQNTKNPGYWHDSGSYTPQPGDLIFFRFDRNTQYVNHVGIVTGVSNGTVYTIEGNTSNSVRERSYLLSNTYIRGYATPDYNETGVTVAPKEEMGVAYVANVEGKGWGARTEDGKEAGTTGSAKMLEALKVELSGDSVAGGVTYRSHMQTYGWQGWVSDGAVTGIADGSKRMEAVEIKLTGEAEKQYDIYYQVHCQTFGWLDWAKNGESAGSAGYAKRVEAIKICLVPKGGAAPGRTARPFMDAATEVKVSYSTHCQTYGWLAATSNGVMNGTEGQAKRLEGIKVNLSNVSGGISYRTHVQTYGWQGWVKNGDVSGTTGEAKRLEAIEIKLSGAAAEQYDIYYRVHCQTYGWMGWAKNGEAAGSSGQAKRLEAIEIRLVPKGGAAPGSTERHYVTG